MMQDNNMALPVLAAPEPWLGGDCLTTFSVPGVWSCAHSRWIFGEAMSDMSVIITEKMDKGPEYQQRPISHLRNR